LPASTDAASQATAGDAIASNLPLTPGQSDDASTAQPPRVADGGTSATMPVVGVGGSGSDASVGVTVVIEGGVASGEGGSLTTTHADGPVMTSEDVDAGGRCTSLTFVDPTGALPLSGSICSRSKPNSSSYLNCAAGSGKSNSATIGPAGGTLELQVALGTFSMTFAPNAVASPTQITVTELAVPTPAGFADWTPLYRVDPVDLVLAAPAKLNVPFGNSCCPAGTAICGPVYFSRDMGLFWSGAEACTLERLSDSYVNAGIEQSSTTRLGFAIVGFASVGGATYCQ
jgi:hypothetical protein